MNVKIDYTVSLKMDFSREVLFSKTLDCRAIDADLWKNTAPIVESVTPEMLDGIDIVFLTHNLMDSMSHDLYRAARMLSAAQEARPDMAGGINLGDARLGATPIGQRSLIGYRIDPDIVIGVKVDIDPDGVVDADACPCDAHL